MIEENARLSIFDAQKHLLSAESKCPLSLTCNLCKGETFASIDLLHRHLANDCPGVIEKCPGCKNLMTRATMKTSEHYECYCIGQESLAVKQNNPKELVKAFQQLTGVGDPVDGAGPETMIADLQASHETVSKALGEGIEAAEQTEDPVTADLFTERRAAHDKHAWMLRSHLA